METVASLRSSGLETPIVLMGYCNSFLAYGIERLAIDAAQAGVDGFIIPDLPSTMADPWVDVLSSNGLDLIFFLAPTTSEQRAASIVQKATGFLYCISVTGVTGARENLTEELPVFLKYARSLTDLPLCVGFGITNATHVNQVSQYADGAIVGSALINLIKRSEPAQVEMKVREFIETLKRATRTVVKR
ncbi:Tryptophan synthase alpha chain [compost metagenome]